MPRRTKEGMKVSVVKFHYLELLFKTKIKQYRCRRDRFHQEGRFSESIAYENKIEELIRIFEIIKNMKEPIELMIYSIDISIDELKITKVL